jgi:hypothetical protein
MRGGPAGYLATGFFSILAALGGDTFTIGLDILGREYSDLWGGEEAGVGLYGDATELNGCILSLRKI